jgi:hypothetical protein
MNVTASNSYFIIAIAIKLTILFFLILNRFCYHHHHHHRRRRRRRRCCDSFALYA